METTANIGQLDDSEALRTYLELTGRSVTDAIFLLREIDREIPEVWPDGWGTRPSSVAEQPECVDALSRLLGALRIPTISPAIRLSVNKHAVRSKLQWILGALAAHRHFSIPSATSQTILNFIQKGYASGLFSSGVQKRDSNDEGK